MRTAPLNAVRAVFYAIAMIALAPIAQAEEPIALRWPELIPKAQAGSTEALLESLRELYTTEDETGLGGVVAHGMGINADPSKTRFVEEFNGKQVNLPGYIVPLDLNEEGTKTFLMVPYIGACIHVPPPPPNQIVLVEASERYPMKEYFEPVIVTGIFDRLTGQATELAEVGYRIDASQVELLEVPAQ
ncbi:MAG: DUF3299 domain-containing protein [Neomegalonema sp.]|nr:DUF3299 domain-containing protein [Neomegalonema sp.]